MLSRRMLRTAIFPSSPNFFVSFTSSRRRSSFRGGIGTRTMLRVLHRVQPEVRGLDGLADRFDHALVVRLDGERVDIRTPTFPIWFRAVGVP